MKNDSNQSNESNKSPESTVLVNINGVQGEVPVGQTLLQAAKQIGAGLAHLCFGNGLCSTCRVKVSAGMTSLSEKQMKERVSLDYHLEFGETVRLACQAKVQGPDPIVVEAPKLFRWIAPRNKVVAGVKPFNIEEAVRIAEAAKSARVAQAEAAAKAALEAAVAKAAEQAAASKDPA
jgi:ferredoxin